MEIKVTEEFEKWATGFSGCDGGNLDGPIWFCGIEFGGTENSTLKFDIASEPPFPASNNLPRMLGFQYNKKVAKLYATLIGESISNYQEIAKRRHLFDRDGDLFKMNLYPISFHDEQDGLWEKWQYKKTGLPTKSLYRAWCQQYRFPKIREWMRQGMPRVVIATGLSYRSDFVMAFSGVDQLYEPSPPTEVSGRQLYLRKINEGQTILAITPFLGNRYGLSSDQQITEFGKVISDCLNKEFGPQWMSKDPKCVLDFKAP